MGSAHLLATSARSPHPRAGRSPARGHRRRHLGRASGSRRLASPARGRCRSSAPPAPAPGAAAANASATPDAGARSGTGVRRGRWTRSRRSSRNSTRRRKSSTSCSPRFGRERSLAFEHRPRSSTPDVRGACWRGSSASPDTFPLPTSTAPGEASLPTGFASARTRCWVRWPTPGRSSCGSAARREDCGQEAALRPRARRGGRASSRRVRSCASCARHRRFSASSTTPTCCARGSAEHWMSPHPRTDLVAARRRGRRAAHSPERHLHARYLRRQASLIRVADKALDAIAPRVDQASARGAPLKRCGVRARSHARPRSPLSDSPRHCGRAWGEVARRPAPPADQGRCRAHEASGIRSGGDRRRPSTRSSRARSSARGRPPTSSRTPTRPSAHRRACRRSSRVAVRRTCSRPCATSRSGAASRSSATSPGSASSPRRCSASADRWPSRRAASPSSTSRCCRRPPVPASSSGWSRHAFCVAWAAQSYELRTTSSTNYELRPEARAAARTVVLSRTGTRTRTTHSFPGARRRLGHDDDAVADDVAVTVGVDDAASRWSGVRPRRCARSCRR